MADTIEIVVNGQARRIRRGASVAALLGELGVARERVAVERNREIIPRAEHEQALLEEGDRLEVVSFVGGG